jgi:hypothetical protein
MDEFKRDWGKATISGDTMTVTSGSRSYQIDLKGACAPERETCALNATQPTEDTDGARLRFVESYGEKPGYVGDEIAVQLVSAKDPANELTEANAYYMLETFGAAPKIDLAPEPNFRLVALDETSNWSDDVTAVTGRIQGVYIYDDSRATHCCEITPSYWLEFMYNAPENAIGDGDGDPDDDRPSVPGFDTATSFEYENGGEYGKYVHCHSIDALDDAMKHDCGKVSPKDLEGYRCAPERLREALYEEIAKGFREGYDCNRMFEGHFEAPAPALG